MTTDPLINPEVLARRLAQAPLTLLDATWTFAGGPQPVLEGAIAGARHFDIDAISDPATDLPHMLPRPDAFHDAVARLGVTPSSTVIVYDRIGVFSAPRVWWSLRAMGYPSVLVLDGGLPAWAAAGLPLTDELSPPLSAEEAVALRASSHAPRPRPELVADLAHVAGRSKNDTLIDARPRARFLGDAPEPRAGLRRGHAPGAVCVPWSDLITPERRMRSAAELASIFEEAGAPRSGRLIASCGSGVTACIVALAMARLGHQGMAVYDGSWAEWGAREDTPVVRGDA